MDKNQTSKYTDKAIVEGILAGNHTITSYFFCNECKRLFYYIHSQICNYRFEPNEIANELFIYISDKNWHKLRLFNYQSRLITWFSVVAIRYFRRKMNELIEIPSDMPLNYNSTDFDSPIDTLESYLDIHNGLSRMPNVRYRMVIQKLDLQQITHEDLAKEMNITTANLYNIHKRALQQLKAVMYGKEAYNG